MTEDDHELLILPPPAPQVLVCAIMPSSSNAKDQIQSFGHAKEALYKQVHPQPTFLMVKLCFKYLLHCLKRVT